MNQALRNSFTSIQITKTKTNGTLHTISNATLQEKPQTTSLEAFPRNVDMTPFSSKLPIFSFSYFQSYYNNKHIHKVTQHNINNALKSKKMPLFIAAPIDLTLDVRALLSNVPLC